MRPNRVTIITRISAILLRSQPYHLAARGVFKGLPMTTGCIRIDPTTRTMIKSRGSMSRTARVSHQRSAEYLLRLLIPLSTRTELFSHRPRGLTSPFSPSRTRDRFIENAASWIESKKHPVTGKHPDRKPPVHQEEARISPTNHSGREGEEDDLLPAARHPAPAEQRVVSFTLHRALLPSRNKAS